MKKNQFLIFLLFVAMTQMTFGQGINIFDIDTTNYPTIKAKFYAYDKDGNQARPSASELSITEDGVPRTITGVSCPASKPPIALSSVLVIDVSGSMKNSNINLAKVAATTWVNALPLGKSECAISSFDHSNYLNQDFTKDKTKLLAAINNLQANGGTDYDMAFLNPIAGGLLVSKKGKNKKVLVMLTDGQAPSPQTQAIINEANNQNCVIFCVALGMPAPQPLKDIANQTGGQYFENVTSVQEAEEVYRKILQSAQGGGPCDITWESDAQCLTERVNVQLTWNTVNSNSSYKQPTKAVASLKISPSFISFGKISNPTIKDTTITLSAINFDFIINDIKLKFGSTIFSIVNTSFPLTIPKNTSKTITLRCAPIDTSLNYASFEIETNLCPFYFSANGGYPGKKMSIQTLKLTHPNGGEIFAAGSDTIITWEGISPTDTVSLNYSIDSGKTWKTITKQAIGLKYEWKNIPLPTSTNCLIKVEQKDLKPNLDTANTGSLLYTLNGHKSELWHISWSPDGSRVATADRTGKIWDANTGQLLHTLNGHTGVIYPISWSPDGSKVATASGDNTSKIWDANTGQLLFTLNGHKDDVWHISWSPDGSRLATASRDSTGKIWDANTGLLLHTLNGHTEGLRLISWSPDGSRVATASNAGKIWDANTGQLLFTLNGHTNIVWHISWSPDGSRLATASYDRTGKIWDANTGQLLNTLTGHSDILINISWSPDGSRVATASGDRTGKIWDANSGQLLYTLNRHTGNVRHISWSPDGSRVATASDDNTGKIWDANTGQLLHTLNGHKDYVRHISWSPDGSKVATASIDRTGKIWEIDPNILQSDQSYNVFTIIAPSPLSQDIDMKECLVGNSKDSLITEFIMNKWSYPYRVDSVFFTGTDATAFSQVSGFPKFIVGTNSSKTVELRFKPNKVGLHQAKVHIVTQTETLIQNIIGTGFQPTIQIVNDFIDFGYIDVGLSKDTLQAITIKNISNVDIDIKNSYHSGPNDKDFSTLQGGGAFKLLAGTTAKLDMRFLPTSVGRTSGTLMFEHNGVGSPAVVQLFGAGVIPTVQVINNSIDFGKVKVGNEKDTLNVLSIKNIGKTSLEISNIYQNGPNLIDFSELNNLKNKILQPDEELKLDIKFKPTDFGKKIGSLIFEYDGEGSPAIVQLFGQGIIPIIQVITNSIDFGRVKVGIEKDTIQVVTIKNIGNMPLTINKIYQSGPDILDFLNLNNANTLIIQEDEELKLDIKFKPSKIGVLSSVINFEHDAAGNLAKVDIIGEGISSGVGGKALMKLDSIETKTSTIVEYPVKLTLSSDLIKSGASAVNFDVTYNNTLLYPIGNYSLTNENGYTTIKFVNVPLTTDPIQILQTLRFKTGLGNAIETPLTIGNFELIRTAEEVDITLFDGHLLLTDVCYNGGVRLLNPNSQITMSRISPNPVDSKITIDLTLIEIGKTEVAIYNLMGEKVKTIFSKDIIETGNISINSEISDLSNGQYVVIFTTPTYTERSNILILK